MIRNVKPEDAPDIAAIYNDYIIDTDITFETEPVTDAVMLERILDTSGRFPYLVFEYSGVVEGYCYASQWKKRAAYNHTVESTVYLRPSFTGSGTGSLLMQALLEELKIKGVHAVIACITLPNPASINMHEKLGFKQVSHYREVGYKFERWIDVGDWELLL